MGYRSTAEEHLDKAIEKLDEAIEELYEALKPGGIEEEFKEDYVEKAEEGYRLLRDAKRKLKRG